MTRSLSRLARLLHRRRGRVVLAWIGLLVAVIALAPALAGDYQADYGTKGSESERAAAALANAFPGQTGDSVTVAWKADGGARAGDARRRVDAFLREAGRLEGVGRPGAVRSSRDGTIATTELDLEQRGWDVPVETGEKLIALAERTTGDGLTVAVGGGPVQQAEEGGSPEGVGLLVAAVVLLVAFGSVVAAGLPLVIALFGLAISALLGTVLAAVVDVPDWAPAIAGLIGIGVGIDYALLVLTRFRARLRRDGDVGAAVEEAVTTAGHSVLVAGTTVLISLMGLFFVGVSYLNGVALAASLAVLVVMAAAVTLLPALLSYAGPRVDRLRIPGLSDGLREGESTPAARWSRLIQRRPWPAVLAGTLVVLTLAVPAARTAAPRSPPSPRASRRRRRRPRRSCTACATPRRPACSSAA